MSEVVEAAPSATTTSKYDLTRTISKYLDLHMMFPLLDFVEMSNIYPADQVAQARLDLLDATNMVRVCASPLPVLYVALIADPLGCLATRYPDVGRRLNSTSEAVAQRVGIRVRRATFQQHSRLLLCAER